MEEFQNFLLERWGQISFAPSRYQFLWYRYGTHIPTIHTDLEIPRKPVRGVSTHVVYLDEAQAIRLYGAD